ncbi:MAG: NIPSNAP family protein [Chitinophagaceae bacterium]|nr:NIPSNAP family protein [Chitinophagaceae bacterium]
MKKLRKQIPGKLIVMVFLLFSFASKIPAQQKREYYQLTVYHYTTETQEKQLDTYLQQALIPALHCINIKSVGVFKAIGNDTAVVKKVYVLVPVKSLTAVTEITKKLSTDKAYLTSGADYLNAAYTAAPYERMETILLQAFSLAPAMQLPQLKSPKKERVYELRSYESATEKIFQNKVNMFNEGDEIGLFKRLNFNAIFYAEVIAGSKMPNLMYMTSFESMDDRNAHWKKFVEDPYWKKLSSMPEYKNNVSHIDILFLRPTDYSDY